MAHKKEINHQEMSTLIFRGKNAAWSHAVLLELDKLDTELCEDQNFSLLLLQQIAPGDWFALLNFPTMNLKFLFAGKSELVLNLCKFCHVLSSLACSQLRVNMLSDNVGERGTMYVQDHHTKGFKSKQKKRPSVGLIVPIATVLPRSLTLPRKRT